VVKTLASVSPGFKYLACGIPANCERSAKTPKPRIPVVYVGPDGRPTGELKFYSEEEVETK
jgi:hypothetical protein